MSTKNLKFFAIILLIIINMIFNVVCSNHEIEKIDNLSNQFEFNKISNKNVEIQPMTLSIEIEEENWWTDYDLELLARTIYWEAGSDEILNEHQQLVAAVVLNRVNDARCPNTIYDVIMDDKYGIQYSTRYYIVSDNQPEIPQRCYNNALAVLNGEIDYPSNLIYQANDEQGFETWKTFETSCSTTYFCRG